MRVKKHVEKYDIKQSLYLVSQMSSIEIQTSLPENVISTSPPPTT